MQLRGLHRIIALTGEDCADRQFSEMRRYGPCASGFAAITNNGLHMIALVYAQLHPAKTMRQLIDDRCLYRVLILGMLVMNWCF